MGGPRGSLGGLRGSLGGPWGVPRGPWVLLGASKNIKKTLIFALFPAYGVILDAGGPGEIWGGPQAPSDANGQEARYLIALGIPERGFFTVFIMFFVSFLICDVI